MGPLDFADGYLTVISNIYNGNVRRGGGNVEIGGGTGQDDIGKISRGESR